MKRFSEAQGFNPAVQSHRGPVLEPLGAGIGLDQRIHQKSSTHLYEPCHGHTNDHPGPRKNVPIAVNTTSSNKNQVITQ